MLQLRGRFFQEVLPDCSDRGKDGSQATASQHSLSSIFCYELSFVYCLVSESVSWCIRKKEREQQNSEQCMQQGWEHENFVSAMPVWMGSIAEADL